MIKIQQGLLERQSLEDSCFVADGEDSSGCESGVVLLSLVLMNL